MTRRAAGPAILLLLAACATNRPTQQHMFDHFQNVADIEAALIRGDLEGARIPARYLADHSEVAGLPQSGAPWLAAMRAEARTVAGAQDLPTAGGAAARMAKTCGDCHHASGEGPRMIIGSMPREGGSSTTTEMLLHQWAADRMRDGLIGPSDSAWAAGARALANDPIYQAEVGIRTGRFQEMEEMARRTVELGRRAASLRDGYERADAYGEFVASCAVCHRAIGVLQRR